MEQMGMIQPPQAVLRVIHRLEGSGYQAWCVGGCVRDSLLGKKPFDWDVTTSALPQETKACFPGERLVEVGISHGTVALVGEDEHAIEITTFRTETGYSDGRHPDSVQFSPSLEADLSRRDFTVNAMAYHPERGIVDLFGGREDLEQGILRCVGEPAKRFSEDALRILRCLRFASQLGFTIEEKTGLALRETKPLLLGLSHERVQEELTKLLCGQNGEQVLREYGEVVFTVLPELEPMKDCTQENPYHCYTVWEHTLHALSHAPKEPVLRWAVFLHDIGKPGRKTVSADGVAHFYGHPPESGRIAREILERLRFSNRQRERIAFLVDHHEDAIPMKEKRLKELLGQYGEEAVFQLFDVMESDLSAKAPGVYQRRLPDLEKSRVLTREILARGDCLTLEDMAVKGTDLKKLGVPSGPVMGELLHRLLEGVMEGKVANEKEALEQYVLRLLEKSEK